MSYAVMKLVSSASVPEFVANLHIIGYDTMSFGKLLTIWYKRNIFRKRINELVDLWPMDLQDDESNKIKREKLSRLRIGQICYCFWNVLGVWLYNLTPVVIYVYHKIQGNPSNLGYIWHISYPFDKTKSVYHELCFAFEVYGGLVSVWSMLASDILFMTMASHISMLLRLLQIKILRLVRMKKGNNVCYEDIVAVIKIHQRLITYGTNLESAFSVVNLINVLLSSITICCIITTSYSYFTLLYTMYRSDYK
ncbi:putative odorant receptor OR12 [Danaus plexippus plexippus]|uniref:Odorant receptor OR12 n=1 Tax=Danaus plexippus plexippus TaxID=278856 RepID=A0A212ELH4_DANPL|nr:putative odorant receptor OR12 [Danaus plexippus plexippus]